MMKRILPALILASGLLTAETFENIAWEFPPAKFEWKLLLEDANFKKVFADNDLAEPNDIEEVISAEEVALPVEGEDLSSSELTAALPSVVAEEKEDDFRFKIFTHREGDAMELFVVERIVAGDDEEEEDNTPDTLESAQKELNETVNKIFPTYKMQLLSVEDQGSEGFAEWELTDGIQEMMHGFTRAFKSSNKTFIICYMTTAVRTEYNSMLWKNVLNQTQILN